MFAFFDCLSSSTVCPQLSNKYITQVAEVTGQAQTRLPQAKEVFARGGKVFDRTSVGLRAEADMPVSTTEGGSLTFLFILTDPGF